MSSKDDSQRNDIFPHLDLDNWDWDLNLDNFDWDIDLSLDSMLENMPDLDFNNWDWDINLMDKLMEDMPLLDITDF
ncbi:hypothetical protein [Megamonas hypermegale]|uniref:hypothetical protein n=1 Tax=Megamonas hypermegale TaxID=158847 RepID=UPI0026E99CE4|nr:hypothetical protein [Megamonas hypermegale]